MRIKRSRILFKSVLFLLTLSGAFLFTLPAHASFNANNLMDDGVFDNSGTMTASGIDNWLNTNFGSASCISTSHGFTAPEPIGYSSTGPTATGGFSYGNDVSAGTIIYDASRVYGLNPQVILTILEKEESLVSGSGTSSNPGCSTWRYTSAMGYLCTDTVSSHNYSGFELYSINGVPVNSVTGTCVQSDHVAGFSRQVLVAAWQLKYSEQRSEGNVNWDVQLNDFPHSGNIWDNSDDPLSCYRYLMTQGYRARANSTNSSLCPTSTSPPANSVNYYDGLTTIDGTSVHLDTGPTASLYDYTPHLHGNQLFVNIFTGTGWFGSTLTPNYSAQPVWQNVYTDNTKTTSLGWNATLLPGQTAYASVVMRNTGNITWTSSVSYGTTDTRLATYGPWDRQSAFCSSSSTWVINCIRAAALKEAIVAPGGFGTFEFPITAPTQTGTYNEAFGLVVDGKTTFSSGFMNFQINVVPPVYSAQPVWQNVYTDSATSLGWNATLLPGQSAYASVVMKNTGNVTWTNSGGFGTTDTRLATYGPWGRTSAFCTGTWVINCTRPAALKESSVAPGKTGTFEFPITAPTQTGTYNEAFGLVVDGKTTFSSGFMNFQLNVVPPVYSAQPVWQNVYSDSARNAPLGWNATLLPGQTAYASVVMKNTGNITWTSSGGFGTTDTRLATYGPWGRQSAFCSSSSSWVINCTRPAALKEAIVAPGGFGTFEFPITAPTQTGTYNEAFGLVVDGKTTFSSGFMNFQLSVHL